MKSHILMLAKSFPSTHPRAGEATEFSEGISSRMKIHTIRNSYYLWLQKATEINAGNAILSVRQWSGAPYRSKQEEIQQYTELGIEEILMRTNCSFHMPGVGELDKSVVAKNDGLNLPDFNAWFEPSKYAALSLAVLHFTDFRYSNITAL